MATINDWNNQVLAANVTFNGGTMSIGTDATDNAINIGTAASAGRTVTIGNATGTSTIAVNCGTGGVTVGTSATAHATTVGSTSSTSATTLQSGSGALAVTSTGGTLTINSGTGALSISNDASATTVTIATGGAVKTTTLGSTNTTSTTTLNAGSGGVNVSNFLALPTSTSTTTGIIKLGANVRIHNYGADADHNIFMGFTAGNFTMTTGSAIANTGLGWLCLNALTTGQVNTAVGAVTQNAVTTGQYNCSYGYNTLPGITTGSYNTSVGASSGSNITTGDSSNIYIGYNVAGTAGESNKCRIGVSSGTGNGQINATFIQGINGVTVTGTAVLCATNGQLGTIASSIRFKENIEDMGSESDSIYDLRPVIFNYKSDDTGSLQYGLIAEEVRDIIPNLALLDAEGIPSAVKYHDLPVLLLNELQKLRKEFDELKKRLK